MAERIFIACALRLINAYDIALIFIDMIAHVAGETKCFVYWITGDKSLCCPTNLYVTGPGKFERRTSLMLSAIILFYSFKEFI